MELEGDGEFTAAEVGLMECLAFSGTAFEHIEMFPGGLISRRFGTVAFEASVEDVDAGGDEITDVTEEEGSALLTFLIDIDSKSFGAAFIDERSFWIRGLFANFVPPDVGEADGADDGDAVNKPTDLRFPVDGFKDAASGGRRDNIIGDALDFHFGTREEGVVAGDFESDGRFHVLADKVFGNRSFIFEVEAEVFVVVGLGADEDVELAVAGGFELMVIFVELVFVDGDGVALEATEEIAMKRDGFVAEVFAEFLCLVVPGDDDGDLSVLNELEIFGCGAVVEDEGQFWIAGGVFKFA